MKRKVAVFTNGWNDEYLEFALEGIRRRAAEDNIDVFIFLDYTSYDKTKAELNGELNILNLPQLKDFDGVLLLGNTLNNAAENVILREKLLKVPVPSICLEYELDGINCIRTENVTGMKELMEHMITVHGVKNIFWVGGPRDNADNNERYQAVIETMQKHGLPFDPDQYFDGCWSYAIVEEQLPDVIWSMTKMPDAFICANDSMALAVCSVLDKAGIRVPQDVKVTGFDNLAGGNHYSPILSSVDRGWNTRSYQAMDSLIELMNDAPDFGDKVFNSTFDPGESCGCTVNEEALRIQKEASRRTFLVPVERTIFDWHLIGLDDSVVHVETPDDIHAAFSALWEKNHSYEGDEFFVCLDKKFVDSMEKETTHRAKGYSSKLDVIYGMKAGATVSRHKIPAKLLVPFYDPESPQSAMYLFVPLHSEAECLGYFVMKNNLKIIRDFYLNSLTRHISAALERARQNIRLENLNKLLEEISVRDELTGLYNRMGYEKIVIPYLDSLRRKKSPSVIMVADINRMKVINDKYGHLQGDLAIRIVANALKTSIPKSWKAVRYGGDEYVIIGDAGSSVNMEKIKEAVFHHIKQQADDLLLPYKLSVSVGYVMIDPENTLKNEEYFRMADEAMYEMKQEAHKHDK